MLKLLILHIVILSKTLMKACYGVGGLLPCEGQLGLDTILRRWSGWVVASLSGSITGSTGPSHQGGQVSLQPFCAPGSIALVEGLYTDSSPKENCTDQTPLNRM